MGYQRMNSELEELKKSKEILRSLLQILRTDYKEEILLNVFSDQYLAYDVILNFLRKRKWTNKYILTRNSLKISESRKLISGIEKEIGVIDQKVKLFTRFEEVMSDVETKEYTHYTYIPDFNGYPVTMRFDLFGNWKIDGSELKSSYEPGPKIKYSYYKWFPDINGTPMLTLYNDKGDKKVIPSIEYYRKTPKKIPFNDLTISQYKTLEKIVTQLGKKIDDLSKIVYRLNMKKIDLKPIICPQCNSNINTKIEQDTYICEYCDTIFILNWV